MNTVLAVLAVVLLAAGLTLLVSRARTGRLGQRTLLALAGLSATGLVAMTISDWPQESLADFWSKHSVLSAVLSTLLLVGAGFMAFEARDNARQQELGDSLASAACGGLVGVVMDVDDALCLLQLPAPVEDMTSEGRPLRWLRETRNRIAGGDRPDVRDLVDGRLRDVRDPWRLELVRQAIRRLMAGMREWAPLMTPSRDGTGVLVRIGALRNDLVALERALLAENTGEAEALVTALRRECLILALGLDLSSGMSTPRSQVRTSAPGGFPADVEEEMRSLLAIAQRQDFALIRSRLGSMRPRRPD